MARSRSSTAQGATLEAGPLFQVTNEAPASPGRSSHTVTGHNIQTDRVSRDGNTQVSMGKASFCLIPSVSPKRKRDSSKMIKLFCPSPVNQQPRFHGAGRGEGRERKGLQAFRIKPPRAWNTQAQTWGLRRFHHWIRFSLNCSLPAESRSWFWLSSDWLQVKQMTNWN